jgi:hypothetical protein
MNENMNENTRYTPLTSTTASLIWRRVGIVAICLILLVETILLATLAPTDVTHYQCYALLFWLGSHTTDQVTHLQSACSSLLGITSPQSAFHTLPKEYPPLTIVLFSLPLLVPLPYYAPVFGCFILLCAVGLYWLLKRLGPPHSATLFALYLVLGACAILQVRFDLLPAACMLLALLSARYQRWTTAYVVLAIGVLLKLYPIVAFPVLFIAEQQANVRSDLATESFSQSTLPTLFWRLLKDIGHWQWKNVLIFVAILIAVTGGFGLLNFQQGVVSPFAYFINRPVQIETIDSTIFWLASHFGATYSIKFSYGSLNIESNSISGVVTRIGSLLEILGFIFIFIQQLRRKFSPGQAMIALLCVLILTGKVFSPQYFIWLIPLVAYVGASRIWLRCWGVLLLLTTGIYIFYYSQIPNAATAAIKIQTLPGFFEVVGLRNLFFLLLALAYLFNWFQSREISRPAILPSPSQIVQPKQDHMIHMKYDNTR